MGTPGRACCTVRQGPGPRTPCSPPLTSVLALQETTPDRVCDAWKAQPNQRSCFGFVDAASRATCPFCPGLSQRPGHRTSSATSQVTWDQLATLPPRLTSGCSSSPWQRQPEHRRKTSSEKQGFWSCSAVRGFVSLRTVSTGPFESPDGLGDACVTRLCHLARSQSHWAKGSLSVDLNRSLRGPPDRKTEGRWKGAWASVCTVRPHR